MGKEVLSFLLLLSHYITPNEAFSTGKHNTLVDPMRREVDGRVKTTINAADLDFLLDTESLATEEEVDENEGLDLKSLDATEIKDRLLDLLPRMMGTAEEFKEVESYVNELEDRYAPVQTLDFLNLAMSGDWQLLFSTNLASGPKPTFRLRELFQTLECNSLEGKVVNQAAWELAEDGATFDASGTFSVECSYKINQGARMVIESIDNILRLGKGSAVPKDVEGLMGQIHRAMPTEMFDPTDHAMDTTYLDADMRIVRMTGPKFEGVRDIFIRRGSMDINPVKEN